MSNTTKTNLEELKQELKSLEIWEKISNLSEIKGQTQSSMITLIIPPKYCI
jgi:hypothetical protein